MSSYVDCLYHCTKCGRTDLTYSQADLHANGSCPADPAYQRRIAESERRYDEFLRREPEAKR